MTNGHGNAVISGSLPVNDIVGAVFHLAVDSFHGVSMTVMAPELTEIMNRYACHISTAPYSKLTVPVLANDKSVDALCINGKVFAQKIAEPGRIQDSAGTEDTAAGESGDPVSSVGKDIHGIGNDQKQAFAASSGDFWNNAFQNADIFVDQIQPCFAGLLVCAGSDDDQGAVDDIIISTCVNAGSVHIGTSVTKIHGFALGFLTIRVDQYQFCEKALVHQAESCSGSHETTADHSGFSHIYHKKIPPFPISVRERRFFYA